MIEMLTGTVALKHLTGIVLDVNGVGYGVDMTDGALAVLAVGQGPLVVWVHTHVREDTLRLFGFLAYEEKTLFNLLLSVSGVGPKLAIGILGRLTAEQLAQAVDRDDADVLEDVPGIGARQSKKILLELKPKITKLLASGAFTAMANQGALPLDDKPAGAAASLDAGPKKRQMLDKQTVADLQSALENFGYKEKELAPILRQFERKPPAGTLAELIRLALAELSGARRAEGAKGAEPRTLEDLF